MVGLEGVQDPASKEKGHWARKTRVAQCQGQRRLAWAQEAVPGRRRGVKAGLEATGGCWAGIASFA